MSHENYVFAVYGVKTNGDAQAKAAWDWLEANLSGRHRADEVGGDAELDGADLHPDQSRDASGFVPGLSHVFGINATTNSGLASVAKSLVSNPVPKEIADRFDRHIKPGCLFIGCSDAPSWHLISQSS